MIKSVLLPLGQEGAFALFTQRIGEWWPPERRHTGDPGSAIRLEAAGTFVERARDGREVPLGRVLSWEAPERIVLDFYPGTDPEHPTRVTVSFVAEGAGTRVVIDHRATALSADLWEGRVSRFEHSWDVVLPALLDGAMVTK